MRATKKPPPARPGGPGGGGGFGSCPKSQRVGAVLQNNVMAAALHNGGGGHHGQPAPSPAVRGWSARRSCTWWISPCTAWSARRRPAAGIGHIAVHAFLKAELLRAAQVVALPVARAVGAFAPVFPSHSCTPTRSLFVGFRQSGQNSGPSITKSAPIASASVMW